MGPAMDQFDFLVAIAYIRLIKFQSSKCDKGSTSTCTVLVQVVQYSLVVNQKFIKPEN